MNADAARRLSRVAEQKLSADGVDAFVEVSLKDLRALVAELPSLTRLVFDDGRIVPRSGDLARMLEDVTLESGVKLRTDQNVLVEHALHPMPVMVGIKWRDKDGTHVMAMDVTKLEVVL